MAFRFVDHKAQAYKDFRDRSAITLGTKHIRQFDRVFLAFASAEPTMSVLDVGCGAGLFLQYLKHRGFRDVIAVDYDENLRAALADIEQAGFAVESMEAEAFIDRVKGQRRFDRIVLFDILEHMKLDQCVSLLGKLHGVLNSGGKILIRVPNVTSPWGLRMQFDTFDHVTLFSPGRVRELATLSGYAVTALKGEISGKRRKIIFQRCLHWMLARLLPYHPEIWEPLVICTFEEPA
ncbi:MAG: class I SAM-dependent methyltransferase [Rhodospirillales bacterium]|nr:class I SAM-dependent methyltransferase [Rhodospirillales bacterium]